MSTFAVRREGILIASLPTPEAVVDYLTSTGWLWKQNGPKFEFTRVCPDGKLVTKLFSQLEDAFGLYEEFGYSIRRIEPYGRHFIPIFKGEPQGLYHSIHHFFLSGDWSSVSSDGSYEVTYKNTSRGRYRSLETAFIILLSWKGWSFVYFDRTEALDASPKPFLISRKGNFVCLTPTIRDFLKAPAALTEVASVFEEASGKMTLTLQDGKKISGTPEVAFKSVFEVRGWKAAHVARGPLFAA